MRPKYVCAENFGSFKKLEFYFEEGLALVSGATGAGKSTLCDLIPWALWGVTSKDGNVDEVRSWGEDEPTTVWAILDTPAGEIRVRRVRGTPAENDLYWLEYPSEKEIRGRNLLETQELLSQRLGVDADLYMIGSYFSQFSTADQFFIVKPKDRRAILERIADVSMPVRLAEAASERRKVAKKELEAFELTKAKEQGQLQALESQLSSTEAASSAWEEQQSKLLADLELKASTFSVEKEKKVQKIADRLQDLASKTKPCNYYDIEIQKIKQDKNKLAGVTEAHNLAQMRVMQLKTELSISKKELKRLDALSDICPTCSRAGVKVCTKEHVNAAKEKAGRLAEQLEVEELKVSQLSEKLIQEKLLDGVLASLEKEQRVNERLLAQVEFEEGALTALDSAPNVHADRLEQANKAVNPYIQQVHDLGMSIFGLKGCLRNTVEKVESRSHQITSLSTLYALSFVLRGELLQNAVAEVARETNNTLETYFDGVFRVKFGLEDSDKLTVEITNNGHVCSFKALSGGERRQLTLAFWYALARRACAAAGVSFSLVTMDESFNGLSDDLKVKAFRLLEEIAGEASSVLVIDHSDALKSMFDSIYNVSKVGDESVLTVGGELEAAAA